MYTLYPRYLWYTLSLYMYRMYGYGHVCGTYLVYPVWACSGSGGWYMSLYTMYMVVCVVVIPVCRYSGDGSRYGTCPCIAWCTPCMW